MNYFVKPSLVLTPFSEVQVVLRFQNVHCPPTRILIYTKTCTRTSPTQEAGWEPLFLLRNNFHKSDFHLSFVPPIGGIFKTSKHLI